MDVEIVLVCFHSDSRQEIVRTIATAPGQIEIGQQLEICSETFWVDSHVFSTRLRWRLIFNERRRGWSKNCHYSRRRRNAVAHPDQRFSADADSSARQWSDYQRIRKAPNRIDHHADRAGGRQRQSVSQDERRKDGDDRSGVWWTRRTRTDHDHRSDADWRSRQVFFSLRWL